MFENNQLEILLRSLNDSIRNLENYLNENSIYLSNNEKSNIMKQLQEYKNMQLKIEWIIGNKEAEKVLSENV